MDCNAIYETVGIKWYYVGQRLYKGDNSTDKEIQIAHFKEEFASNIFLSKKIELKIDDEI